MPDLKNCPRCGAGLPGNTVRGLCPKCLALVALGGEADETLVLPAPPSQAAPEAALSSSVRYFGDYQLLEEIARGGMGVVFKARQASLNRVVAVKMILSGQLAGDAEVKRFRTEAEAAANLQHPNIVAIHEIGEHDGRHYFSMDYVEGKNLAVAIAAQPPSPMDAAKLVKTMAEAVHYAHQRGTLHRDLKPQNVLIDDAGQPHITDFGLAKLVNREAGLTETGMVMGSPSYMPPEQATGQQDRIGPASDVYALGAILYQLLAGQPPFRGQTPVETLRQVIEREPESPSKLNPKLPPDLETICLKCLEKRPERRYVSARQLAEELDRFLNHQPVLARPASSLRKLWSWSLRHPWALTGALSILVLGLMGLTFGLCEQNQFLVWNQAHAPSAQRPRAWLFNWHDGLGPLSLPFTWPFMAYVGWVDAKRRSLILSRSQLKVYTWWASLGIVTAIGSAVGGVHDYVWGDRIGLSYVLALAVLPMIWFSVLLFWQVVLEHQRAIFGLEHPSERALFPPQPQRMALTIRQRMRFNRYFLALLIIGLVSTVVPGFDYQAHAIFFWIVWPAFILPSLIAGFGAIKAALRHFFLYAAFGMAFLSLEMGAIVLNPGERIPTKFKVGYLLAGSLSLTAGCFLAKFNLKKSGPVAGLDDFEQGSPAWVKAHSRFAFKAALLASCLALVLLLTPFLSIPDQDRLWAVVLSVFALLIPYECVCWLRAAGPERRARRFTLLLFLAAAAWIAVNVGVSSAARAISLGLALGAAAVLWVMNRSRKLEGR